MIVFHVVESFSTGTLQALRTLCHATSGEMDCHILHGNRNEGACAKPDGFPPTVSFTSWPATREISPHRDYQAIAALKEVVARLRPDLIHAHSSKAGALVRIAFPWGQLPLLYSPHGYSFLRQDLRPMARAVYWSIERLLGWVPHVTVACGIAEYGRARLVSRRVVYIPNMLDVAAIDAIVTPNHRYVATEAQGLRIGTAGGIRPQKNFPLFCAVAAALENTGTQFVWVGSGEIPAAISVPDNVEVTGWLDHAATLSRLAACDIYMQTSLWEGLSIAVLEGMALGLPILATPVPGNTELVIDGYNGYLCGSADDFISRVQSLASDRTTLVRLGAASRRIIEQGFTIDQIAPRWLSLYRHYPRYWRYG
ncbi:Glycosyltransferase involved in cell wall bisynthesis [Gammaproteobacteria bacterium]